MANPTFGFQVIQLKHFLILFIIFVHKTYMLTIDLTGINEYVYISMYLNITILKCHVCLQTSKLNFVYISCSLHTYWVHVGTLIYLCIVLCTSNKKINYIFNFSLVTVLNCFLFDLFFKLEIGMYSHIGMPFLEEAAE